MDKKIIIGVVQEEGYGNDASLATRLTNDFNHYFVTDELSKRIWFFEPATKKSSKCVSYREHLLGEGLDILIFLSEERIEEARKVKQEFSQLKVIVLCEEVPSSEVILTKTKELSCKGYLELITGK